MNSNGSLNRRFVEIMLGLLLVVFGLSGAFGGQEITLLMGLLGFYLLARQFDRPRQQEGSRSHVREREQPAERRPIVREVEEEATTERGYRHAIDAAREAGLNPAEAVVLPVDIGVMAFSGDDDPVIFRTATVPDNIDYLQPFVQLRLPTRAVGRVKFEIIDSDGQVLFIHEDRHQLKPGMNLITPSARLPIHDAHAMSGDWHLRVSADDVPVALHHFGWEESASKLIRRHLSEDGEISNEIRTMMAESRLEKLSLDDLLSDQQEEETVRRRQASGK
jgi:hypothetical protein